jgi:hypothetical protein
MHPVNIPTHASGEYPDTCIRCLFCSSPTHAVLLGAVMDLQAAASSRLMERDLLLHLLLLHLQQSPPSGASRHLHPAGRLSLCASASL